MSQTIFIIIVVAYTVSIPMILLAIKLWDWRVLWRSGYHRVILTDEDGGMQSLLIRIPYGQDHFSVNIGRETHTYGIDTDCVRHLGRFRIPTYEYIVGRAEPLMIREDRAVSFSEKVGSLALNNVAKNVAMAQLIEAFRRGIMNPVNLMIVGFAVILIGMAAVGFWQYSELEKIQMAMGIK
jgi:hypothetical protein